MLFCGACVVDRVVFGNAEVLFVVTGTVVRAEAAVAEAFGVVEEFVPFV